MDEKPFNEAASSAIAGFSLSQITFWAVLQSGLLEKAEAQRMLREAIAANKKGGSANQLAGAKLQVVLDQVSQFAPKPRH